MNAGLSARNADC